MGRVGLLTTIMMSVLVGTAHAFPQEDIATARTALQADDKKAVRDALDLAEIAFAESEGVAPNEVLAAYWYYRGLVLLKRGKTKPAMEMFRQALVVQNDFVWDKDLSADMDARRLFEALRSEVRGRDVHSPKVPEKMGLAQAYVDGSRVRAGDWVAVGQRLAQVQCPEGDVHGMWTTFSEELDWLALCPYEVDTSIDIYAATGPEDEFGGLAAFGEVPLDEPPPQPSPDTNEPEPNERGSDVPQESTTQSNSPFSVAELATPRNIVMTVGGAMMTSGIIMHFTVVKPAFAMVEWGRRNPHELSRYQADILTERFVNRRRATWTVFGIGAGVVTTGFFALKPTSLQPTVFPGGMRLQGQF